MTEGSVSFYRKTYPHAQIIVSTWNDEPTEILKEIAALGATVITSAKPTISGNMNVNLQLITSLAGVKKADELGCLYAVKTRTDQRVCKPFIFDIMISIIRNCKGVKNQKGRLVTLGYPSGGMFIPYQTCDFLYLGYTEDLIRFFSAPLDERICNNDIKVCKYGQKLTRHENSKFMHPPEIYMMKHYCMDVLGFSGEDSVKEYWHIVKDCLILFGMKDIDLMWDKYHCLYNLNYYSSAYFGDSDSPERLGTMCFDFFTWMRLCLGDLAYDEKYEYYGEYMDAIHINKQTIHVG